MSTKKKGKSNAAAKRKSTVPAKGKSAVLAHAAALESRTGHWTQWIEPKRAAFISENLMPVHFVIKNRGPAPVFLVAGQGKQMDLGPDAVHATYACGTVWVENRDEKLSALVEFDFLPIFRK
jgi:hypothetical protein